MKDQFRSASFVGDKIVITIAGNRYRLVVGVDHAFRTVCVKWVGTHKNYDKPDIAELRTMDIAPIRSDADHDAALAEIDRLWGSAPDTPDGKRLEVLVTLVDAYEEARHPMPPADPIASIEFMMEQRGLTRRDLGPMIGSRARVSEVLNRQRPLTLPMIRRLSEGLRIPVGILVREDEVRRAA